MKHFAGWWSVTKQVKPHMEWKVTVAADSAELSAVHYRCDPRRYLQAVCARLYNSFDTLAEAADSIVAFFCIKKRKGDD